MIPRKVSIIPDYIESLRPYFRSKFTTVCLKDSRELTLQDMQEALETIEKSKGNRIIVTDGTYTVADTARFLKAKLKRKDQVVVLVASMMPIDGFASSDGPFNLGFAVAKTLDLLPGVYVAVNARVFSPEEVAKMISAGRFISLLGKQAKAK